MAWLLGSLIKQHGIGRGKCIIFTPLFVPYVRLLRDREFDADSQDAMCALPVSSSIQTRRSQSQTSIRFQLPIQ